jgi:hypothetical protein
MAFKQQTYCLDVSAWRRGKRYIIDGAHGMNIDHSMVLLSDFEPGVVLQVMQVDVHAAAAPGRAAEALGGCIELTVCAARVLRSPLPAATRRGARRAQRASGAPESVDSEAFSEDEVKDCSSASSCASVDTELDSGVEDNTELPGQSVSAAVLPEEEVWQDWEAAALAPETVAAAPADDVLRGHRHLPGTWKIWEGTWFYVTKTPGWIDVKCCLKHQFRAGEEGLGLTSMSRTLTPYHYGDDWEDPWPHCCYYVLGLSGGLDGKDGHVPKSIVHARSAGRWPGSRRICARRMQSMKFPCSSRYWATFWLISCF